MKRLIFIFLILSSHISFADVFVRCDGCGSTQMSAKAVLTYSPYNETVHVTDSVNNRVRSYRVTITTGGSGDEPLEIGANSVATLISTPADITAGFDEAMKFLAAAQKGTEIPADTLPRIDGTGYINSVSDIIINPANLSRVEGYLQDNLLALSQAVAIEVMNEYLDDAVMRLRFGDGTSAEFTFRAVLEPNGDLRFEFVYVENSSRTADREIVPDSPDDFYGLQIALGGGDAGFPEFLGDLARFWDIPIVNSVGTHIGGGSGGEYRCRSTTTGVLCSRAINN